VRHWAVRRSSRLFPCADDLIETRTRQRMPRGCARIGLPAPHDDIDVERIEFEP
jgi:hypothetical protein